MPNKIDRKMQQLAVQLDNDIAELLTPEELQQYKELQVQIEEAGRKSLEWIAKEGDLRIALTKMVGMAFKRKTNEKKMRPGGPVT
jgi:hypothetical protein